MQFVHGPCSLLVETTAPYQGNRDQKREAHYREHGEYAPQHSQEAKEDDGVETDLFDKV
jgi:hypothetical protein